MKKYILILFIAACSYHGFCQGLFEEKFDNCTGSSSCLNCGDKAARYSKDLGEYIAYKLNHSVVNSTYDLKNFDVFYEVYVDVDGSTCVLSDTCIGYGWAWRIKDDVRKWLCDMSDWEPATKNGSKINSTTIVECRFRNNLLETRYTESPRKTKN